MDLTSQPLVSVVTPVYNGEKFLVECIESVLAQTYKNWEYVIVNNCSTDHSLEIAQNYAEKNAQIRIHNNSEFLSALDSQNHALRQISPKSKYCKVVHADDWLFPECLMQMVKIAETDPSVGIVGSYVLSDVQVICDELPYTSTVVPGREICRLNILGSGHSIFGSPTSLLIRSDIIQNYKPFYISSYYYADQEACYEVLQECNFGFVHQVLTYTRIHHDQVSAVGQKFSWFPGKVHMLKKYGPIYLTREEYEKLFRQKMNDYYRYLAKGVFLQREREFWQYHRNVFIEIGVPLSLYKLSKTSILELIDSLLNPKMTVEKIINKYINRG